MVKTARSAVAYARVPALCQAGTIVCLASGPSLTPADVDHVRGRADAVVVVNDTWRLAPWADALMASDAGWWAYHQGVPTFPGRKYCLEASASKWPGVEILRNTGQEGIERQPTGLRTGRNSGAAAVNLAVHLGAARIILLGYDLEAKDEAHSHWFGAHPRGLRGGSPYALFREMFATMVEPLAAAGVEVVNCSPTTALTCFPRRPLREVLP